MTQPSFVFNQLRWAACQALARRDLSESLEEESQREESPAEEGRESGRDTTVAAQPALLREEDVRPFPQRHVATEPVSPEPASIAVEAPLPPLSNPTASLPEAAADRDFGGTSACVEPPVVVMPAPAGEIEPALPLAAAGN